MTPSDESRGFTPIPNPYITGNPVRGEKVFVGRQDVFEYARQRLETEKEGVVLLFVGERRSGKTSVLFQIQDGRLGQEFLPIFIDMQAIASVMNDWEFFRYMAEKTCDAVQDERIVASYYDFSQGTNPIITFDRLLDDIRRIYSSAKKHLIFLFDEAEILRNKVAGGELTGNILVYMASILESRRTSFFFITGSSGLPGSLSEQWKRLIAKAVYKEISFLKKTDTVRLITEPVAGYVTHAEGAVEEIYNLTYGHPYYTQVICTEVVNYLNSSRKNDLTMEDLEGIIETILDNPPQNMIYNWDELSRPEHLTLSLLSEQSGDERTYITAEALANSITENGYPLEMDADTLHIQMENLFTQKVLGKNEEGAYHFNLDLYRRWIRRSRSIWRLLEEQRPKKSKRPLWIGIAAAVLVVGVTGALLLRGLSDGNRGQRPPVFSGSFGPTTGDLWLESNPPGAEVWIDAEKQQGTTNKLIPNLPPGRHVVEVRMGGYRPWKESWEAIAGKGDTISVQLDRSKGKLSLQSHPSGAQVVIRGKEVDTTATTPIDNLILPTGTYTLGISQTGYVPQSRPAKIIEDASEEVYVNLIANVGNLIIDSVPQGATIFVDGTMMPKKTPAPLDLAVGEHELVLKMETYEDLTKKVSVKLGSKATLSYPLTHLPTTLDLRSTPSGAAIYIDDSNEPIGYTPYPESTRITGKHRVRCVLEGYDEAEFEAEFSPGQKLSKEVILSPQSGWVHIVNFFEPIVIDNKEQKIPPAIRELRVGPHTIQAKDQSISVSITKGDTVTVLYSNGTFKIRRK